MRYDGGMLRKRQFSISFLLLELTCIAGALGMFRFAMTEGLEDVAPLLFLAGVGLFGTALGALVGRPVLMAVILMAALIVATVADVGEFVVVGLLVSIVLGLYVLACFLAAIAVTRVIGGVTWLLQTSQTPSRE